MNASQDIRLRVTRIRARRAQRGAVMVEAMIVMIFMVICMVSVWAMQRLFTYKWITIQQSRAAAWTSALEGCETGKVDLLYPPIHNASKGAESFICGGADCIGKSVAGLENDGQTNPPFWFPVAEANSTSVTISFQVPWFLPQNAGAQHQFSCNEKPKAPLQIDSGGGPLDSATVQLARNIVIEEH